MGCSSRPSDTACSQQTHQQVQEGFVLKKTQYSQIVSIGWAKRGICRRPRKAAVLFGESVYNHETSLHILVRVDNCT